MKRGGQCLTFANSWPEYRAGMQLKQVSVASALYPCTHRAHFTDSEKPPLSRASRRRLKPRPAQEPKDHLSSLQRTFSLNAVSSTTLV